MVRVLLSKTKTATFLVMPFLLGVILGTCVYLTCFQGTPVIMERPPGIVLERRMPAVEPPLDCRESTPLGLLFIVMSSPDSGGARKRSSVRKSWPLTTIYKPPPVVNVTMRFVLGTLGLSKDQLLKLTVEQSTFGDLLLLENHHDTYDQLTEKLQKAVQWADKSVQFNYLIKTDDDVVVRLDNMVHALRRMGCPERLYWGNIQNKAPIRKSGKWKETKWHICETYLPYATGNGYVLGRQLVQSLMKHGHILSHFTNEDVSMRFWLVPYHLNAQYDKWFTMHPSCSNDVILVHLDGHVDKVEKAAVSMTKMGRMCG